jgi:hypothetical protein
MRLEVTKPFQGKRELVCEIKNDDATVVFRGINYKDGSFLVVEGNLTGKIKVICDSSGDDFFDDINEELAIKFTHGLHDGFDKKYDIIETDTDTVDFKLFLTDEIESFKLGFHRKDECGENNFKF